MKKLNVLALVAMVIGSAVSAQADVGAGNGLGAPIGLPDHRAIVSRLVAALPTNGVNRPPSYIGVTPSGRWCQMTVASNGWEFWVSADVAVPGTPWSMGRPTMITQAASFALTMNPNPKRVTGISDDGRVLSVSYEQIMPESGVNFQFTYSGSIRIQRSGVAGQPARVEISEVQHDTWTGAVAKRTISCGVPGSL